MSQIIESHERTGFRRLFNQLETHKQRKRNRGASCEVTTPPRPDTVAGNYYLESDIERMRVTADLINPDVETVLDIGAWDGYFGTMLEQKRKKVVSIDIKPKSHGIIPASITHLPFKSKSFDAVTALEVIEHLDSYSLKMAVKEMTRVARKQIIISVPFEEAPLDLSSGHIQYFDESRLKRLIHCKEIKMVKVGKRKGLDETRALLYNISKSLFYLYICLFGKKTREKDHWIIVVYNYKKAN